MSRPNSVPDILMVSRPRGGSRFSFERLREISICLSNLDTNAELPILQALIEQGDLQKPPSDYKSVLLNCVLDCLRLAQPLSTSLFARVRLKPPPGDAPPGKLQGSLKLSTGEAVSEAILCGLVEHMESLLEAFGRGRGGRHGSEAGLAKYAYSIERATEKNSRVLVFLIESVHESKRQRQFVLIFGLLLDLFELCVAEKSPEMLGICKHAISSMISYSGAVNTKSELVLSFLLKLTKQFKSPEQVGIGDFLPHACSILSLVGVSGISYMTNTILAESVRFLRSEIKPSADFGGEEAREGRWWREESAFVPDLVRRSMHDERVKDVQTRIIYTIHFLESISEEYVQSVITQMICDLREHDDKLRLQTVKMVTRFILLGITLEYRFVFQGHGGRQGQADRESELKKQLIESWLSRANDKQHDIRTEVVMGLVRATNIFLQRSEFGHCERFIKFIIELRGITCPSLREDLVKVVSAWLTSQRKESCPSELVDDSIQYLLRHICDKNRGLRIYLIKYLKDYIEIPELSRSLWLLWYVSFKQGDLQMRNVIEDVLLELNQLETLELYLSVREKPESQCSIAATDNQSNSTVYKVIKTFNYQRLALLRSFRLFVCSLFLIRFNHANLSRYLESLKQEIVKQIDYFFAELEYSKEDAARAAQEMLQKIQDSLTSRQGFEKWAVVLGLVAWNKEPQGETQKCVESVAKELELESSQEFKKIIRYLGVFNINPKTVSCKVLGTIFSPSLGDKGSKGSQACVETCWDSLDTLQLRLQFKYKVSILSHILSGKSGGEQAIQALSDAVGLYNQQEIFKLYECFYLNSKKLFRRKLLKHLRELNSKFKHLDGVFQGPFAENCFAGDGDRRNDFITESLPKDELGIMAKDAMYQMFPGIPTSSIFCSYSDFESCLGHPAILKSSGKHASLEKTVDLFILRLLAERKWQDKPAEEASADAILSRLVPLIEEALQSSGPEEAQCILISKLVGAGCLLLFKASALEEALFDRLFQAYYAFSTLCDAKAGTGSDSSGGPSSSPRVSSEGKQFYIYFVNRVESDLHEPAGAVNSSSLGESIFAFNSYLYAELVNFICFSELENFFRKNHVRVFELGQRLCRSELGHLTISRVLSLDKAGSGRTILSTTLGRSLGMSFIPMLSQKLGSEPGSQDLHRQVEKIIEDTTSVFLNSAIYAKNAKHDQLYCVLECIFSVFIYYVSKTDNLCHESANQSIHCFVKILHTQLLNKLKRNGKSVPDQLAEIGVHCIALLGEIGDNYDYAPEGFGSSETGATRIADICKGTQFHTSYFFISNQEPEIFMRENTSVFDNWNYLRSTRKFRIPSYLFSRAQPKRDVSGASQFEWSVPAPIQSKSARDKKVKSNHKSKLRKLAAPKVRVSEDSDNEGSEARCGECDSDSFSSLSENSNDENWVGNVQLKTGAPRMILRSNNLRQRH